MEVPKRYWHDVKSNIPEAGASVGTGVAVGATGIELLATIEVFPEVLFAATEDAFRWEDEVLRSGVLEVVVKMMLLLVRVFDALITAEDEILVFNTVTLAVTFRLNEGVRKLVVAAVVDGCIIIVVLCTGKHDEACALHATLTDEPDWRTRNET